MLLAGIETSAPVPDKKAEYNFVVFPQIIVSILIGKTSTLSNYLAPRYVKYTWISKSTVNVAALGASELTIYVGSHSGLRAWND